MRLRSLLNQLTSSTSVARTSCWYAFIPGSPSTENQHCFFWLLGLFGQLVNDVSEGLICDITQMMSGNISISCSDGTVIITKRWDSDTIVRVATPKVAL